MSLAIVFDFDGTLVDTQRFHAWIESEFLKKYNIDILPEDITKTYAWRTPRERITEVFSEHQQYIDDEILEAFEKQKNQRIIDLSKEGKITLLPWVKNLLDELHNNNIPIWIASWTSIYALDILIEYFDLGITYYTSADEVEHKKPAPDVFNKTFEKMWIWHTIQKIVIWDGISDVIWGKAAGAKTIYVSPNNKEKAKEIWAVLCISSLEELSLDIIHHL